MTQPKKTSFAEYPPRTQTVRIRVPGTSANCGPGFDTLGVACTIYNELELTLWDAPRLTFDFEGEGRDTLSRDAHNMVWRAAALLLRRARLADHYKGGAIRMVNRIPLSRGLGSSATAIVAGLTAANACIGNRFRKTDILQMATEMEGHPDNVAPAIYGGFTVSLMHGRRAETFSFQPRLPLKLVVAVPDFPLSTNEARAALPKEVPMQDAVFNVGHASLLVAALMKGNARFVEHALEDALHQSYRAHLIPGMQDVFAAARAAGALGAVISGAGPSLIAYTVEHEAAVGDAMVSAFRENAIEARSLILGIDRKGAHVISAEKHEKKQILRL